MKRFLSIMLCTVMLLGNISAVLAEDFQSDACWYFADALDEAGLDYSYEGLTENGNFEIIRLTVNSEIGEIHPIMLFNVKNDSVAITLWDFLTFDTNYAGDVYLACNQLNLDYRYTRFFVDPSMNTISIQIDLFLDPDTDPTGVVSNGLLTLISMLETAYPELAQYQQSKPSNSGSLASLLGQRTEN